MATILCIETATKNCSVALCVNGKVVALQQVNPNNEPDKGFSHAEKLQGYITKVLDQGNISKNDLDAIAVSKGPGSYTGLRRPIKPLRGLIVPYKAS